MKITHANERKPEFVTKHEVGKVYKDDSGIYLLAQLSHEFLFINLATGQVSSTAESLKDVEKFNGTDILVNCELVIKDTV